MPRKALLRIKVVACYLPVDGGFAAVGVVGMAGHARVSIELSVCRLAKGGSALGCQGTSLLMEEGRRILSRAVGVA